MIAFVLSGGGNRGPLEVGALRALRDAGIRPEFLVGSSAGAINAAFVAAHGFSANALDRLADQWRSVDAKTVYPGGLASVAWRVLRRSDSLYPSDGVRNLIERGMPDGVTQFRHLTLPLYVSAADLLSNRLYMFGEDGSAALVDAVLASASVPVIHPPVRFRDRQLVDGGVLANVAASFAMDKGATELYVVNVSAGEQEEDYAEGVVDVAFRTLNTLIVQALLRDLARVRTRGSTCTISISRRFRIRGSKTSRIPRKCLAPGMRLRRSICVLRNRRAKSNSTHLSCLPAPEYREHARSQSPILDSRPQCRTAHNASTEITTRRPPRSR